MTRKAKLSTRKKALKKPKSRVKKSIVKKPENKAKSIKGSVTLHLETQKGVVFTEAELVNRLDEDLLDAWKKLRAFAVELGPQRIYASAQAIMFSKKICYFYVRPKKKYLEVWIFLPRKIEGLTSMQGPTKKEKHCNLFKVIHADQIEEPFTDWIREAYDFAPAMD